MTNKESTVSERLNVSIEKCRIHLQRMQYALNQSENLFPLTTELYASLTENQVGNIDQLVYRFTKLQDELGNNTFRFLLEHLQEDIKGKPFRDILNVLERLSIIESSETWLSLRELRNDLAHEYPILADESVSKLNHLSTQVPLLSKILVIIEKHAK